MKHQKKFKFLFLTFAVIVTIFSLFSAPMVTPFLLGGVILQGILGGFSGKVGPVVGGKWKDIDYMRGYVVPSNPNTAGQQAVRLKFANLVAQGRQILATILQTFWDPFYSNMSGFNAFISQNYAGSNTTGVLDLDAVLAKGTLEAPTLVSGVYTTGTGVIDYAWDATTIGNGESTDGIMVVAYDNVGMKLYTSVVIPDRGDESGQITIASGLTATNVLIYLFARRGTGAELIVSDSVAAICSAT